MKKKFLLMTAILITLSISAHAQNTPPHPRQPDKNIREQVPDFHPEKNTVNGGLTRQITDRPRPNENSPPPNRDTTTPPTPSHPFPNTQLDNDKTEKCDCGLDEDDECNPCPKDKK